jgi:DNA-directed RNA polymerase specialized sigma54-like protein
MGKPPNPKTAPTLVISPQLHQAIRILQCDRAEILGLIEEQLAKNPWLEIVSTGGIGVVETPPETDDASDLRELRREAKWFLRTLEQREAHIRTVVELVSERNREFLAQTSAAPNQISIREAADLLKVHEASLVRIISDKALRCPQGVLALETFFFHH